MTTPVAGGIFVIWWCITTPYNIQKGCAPLARRMDVRFRPLHLPSGRSRSVNHYVMAMITTAAAHGSFFFFGFGFLFPKHKTCALVRTKPASESFIHPLRLLFSGCKNIHTTTRYTSLWLPSLTASLSSKSQGRVMMMIQPTACTHHQHSVKVVSRGDGGGV